MKRALLVVALLAAPWVARAAECDPQRSPPGWMDEGYRRKQAGDLPGAASAFGNALTCGFDPQLASLELAYVAAARGNGAEARRLYEAVGKGPDPKIAAQARTEIAAMQTSSVGPEVRRFWVDVYAEAYAWRRFHGALQITDMVPTLRVRALWRPSTEVDVQLYVFAQATRDLRSGGLTGLPQIYADNTFFGGVGAQLRFWDRSMVLFVQAGPAVSLLDDGRPHSSFDARGGLSFYREHPGCWVGPRPGAAWIFAPCVDGYAEAVWASRFDDNVVAMGRVRAGFAWLVTGPVSWSAIGEGRAAGDRNGDFYNNFAELGAGVRWRLLTPLRVDLLATLDVGSYFGRTHRDPAPVPLTYTDGRLLLVTFFEL